MVISIPTMIRTTLIFFLLTVCAAHAQRAVPPLWGHQVHDEAHVLSHETIESLEATLKNFEDTTSNQIAILIIPSLEGDVLEEYSLRVAHDEWKLGTREKDNGVLLLVAVEDRKMRIEVGQGLEGVLPDAICNRIIRNEMAPRFRSHDYDEGIVAAVNAIMQAIGGEYTNSMTGADELTDLSVGERILIGAFIFGVLGLFTVIGLFVPGSGGWFLYAFLVPFYAVFPMFVMGVDGGLSVLGFYLIGFPILRTVLSRTGWGRSMMKKMEQSSAGSGSGGWSSSSGSFGSSSSSWGSSSSSGFSGGGGSFGGGGSSGSW
jgi:uncharacterized protein